jgi:hypothetical protein
MALLTTFLTLRMFGSVRECVMEIPAVLRSSTGHRAVCYPRECSPQMPLTFYQAILLPDTIASGTVSVLGLFHSFPPS